MAATTTDGALRERVARFTANTASHCEPRWEAGSTPGPYGWYPDDHVAPGTSS